MDTSDPWLVGFLVLAAISIVAMTAVVTHIYLNRDFNSLLIKLLFLLHVTVLVEEIAYLPATYDYVIGLCKFMGWLHYYSGFINVITIYWISLHYLGYINQEKLSEPINNFIKVYGFPIAFIFPLITLLPFSTNSYNVNHGIWCTLPADSSLSDQWCYGIFYSWVIMFLVVSFAQFSYCTYELSQYNLQLGRKLFFSNGVYIIISTFAWIPRILERMFQFKIHGSTNDANLATTAQLYVSGLLYALVYLYGIFYFYQKKDAASANKFTEAVGSFSLDAEAFQNALAGITPGNSMAMRRSSFISEMSFSGRSRTKTLEGQETSDMVKSPLQTVLLSPPPPPPSVSPVPDMENSPKGSRGKHSGQLQLSSLSQSPLENTTGNNINPPSKA
jgi:hypothetical protein